MSTTGKDLVEHWGIAAKKGLLKVTTASSFSVACQRILEVLPDWESLDVRTLDAEDAITKFQNLRHTKYTPKTLAVYAQRFRQAVKSYTEYLADPSKWKPGARQTGAKRQTESRDRQMGELDRGKSVPNALQETAALVEYPYPLRADVNARLLLPRDITCREAKRLCRFLESLAVDMDSGEAGA